MSKPLHKLKKLSVSKVSLVPKGSNGEADVVLYRHDVAEDLKRATFQEIKDAEVARQSLYEIYNACYTMQDAISSSIYGDGDMAEEVRQSVDQFKAYVNDLLDNLGKKKTKKHENLDELARTVVARAAAHAATLAQKETVMKDTKDMTQEELLAHANELQRQLNEKTPASDPKPAAPAVTEEVLRGLPEEVQAVLRASQAQVAALTAANEATTAVVRQLHEESEVRRFEEIVRAELPALPGTVTEKATMLRGLKTLGDAQYEAQLKILKASNAAMQQVALSEIGSRTGEVSADSPMGELQALARTIRTADAKLSDAQAFERACQQRPDLYKQTRTERFQIHRVA